jgi:hypothetical protein
MGLAPRNGCGPCGPPTLKAHAGHEVASGPHADFCGPSADQSTPLCGPRQLSDDGQPETEVDFWWQWLGDLDAAGAVARHLGPVAAAEADLLMARDNPDPDQSLRIQELVRRVQARVWPARYRSAGLPVPPKMAEAEAAALAPVSTPNNSEVTGHDRPAPVPDHPRPPPTFFAEETAA